MPTERVLVDTLAWWSEEWEGVRTLKQHAVNRETLMQYIGFAQSKLFEAAKENNGKAYYQAVRASTLRHLMHRFV